MDNHSKNQPLEISLIDLVAFIRRNILLLLIVVAIWGVSGILYSFTITKTYTAQTVLLPEYKLAGSGSFFSMALGGSSNNFDGAEKLGPELYPSILSTVPFGQYLLKQPIVDVFGSKYTSYEAYLKRDTTSISWMSKIRSVFRPKGNNITNVEPIKLTDSDILNLSSQNLGLARTAFAPVLCNVDSRNGTIVISAEMEDPVVSAEIVEISKKYLMAYVEDYRSSKLEQTTAFLTERVTEAKRSLKNAEYALQSYRDRNRDAYLNVSRIQEQQLESDYVLAQSIYGDLTQRLEQAKIKEKEEKPVFKVLEPTRVPLEKSQPNRKLYGVVFAAVGGFVCLFYIIFKREKLHLKLLENT